LNYIVNSICGQTCCCPPYGASYSRYSADMKWRSCPQMR